MPDVLAVDHEGVAVDYGGRAREPFSGMFLQPAGLYYIEEGPGLKIPFNLLNDSAQSGEDVW